MSQTSNLVAGEKPLTHSEILRVLSGLMMGLFLAALDQTIVSTALKNIVEEFNGLNHYTWVVTAYLLTSTASTPLYGKISDLYGRRPVFQFAIVTFLLGSFLAGAAQDMTQLIAFRALQGLGAGGLMALTFVIIGDIIPPRDRGRYQGYFGAVWGLSSVAGPLLGGYFADAGQIFGVSGWRWIFYLNLPIGIAALILTTASLHVHNVKKKHKIDYFGAFLMVTAVTSLLMGVSVYGPEDGWTATNTLSALGLALLFTIAFLLQERRAVEPILPLHLFKNHTFSITSLLGFVIGAGMFGAIIMIPLYLQLVKGASATEAGLKLIPFMLGIVFMSMYSGKQISKTGSYKKFPIIGLIIMSMGLALLTRLSETTSFLELSVYEFMIGIGLGLSMQPVVIALQNDLDFKDMGIGTSANTFFRSIGSTVGVAIFGTIYANGVATYIPEKVAQLQATNPQALAGATPEAFEALQTNSQILQTFSPELQASILNAFVHAFHDVFIAALPVTALGIVFAFMVREKPLRTGQEFSAAKEEAAGETFA